MNKYFALFLFLSACSSTTRTGDPYPIPLISYAESTCEARGTVHWTATEMRGTRAHKGTVRIDSACLYYAQHELVGGYISVNMEDIDVLDIPPHEVSAKANLIKHLKSPDFFHVSTYPQARLTLIKVRKTSSGRLSITANLQIREVTRGIQFYALEKDGNLSATLRLRRLDWNIAYQGSWWQKTLIDPVIVLHWTGKK